MTNHKLKVALLYGGRSGEHEISLLSAYGVFNALDKDKYEVIPIGLGKDGTYFVNDCAEFLTLPGPALPIKTNNSRELSSLIDKKSLSIGADVVFPMVHGPLYEDGALQGMLEHADCAYVGCKVLSSALAMDKEIAKRLVSQLGIEVADYFVIKKCMSHTLRKEKLNQFLVKYNWPLFVKPLKLGSSVATYKVLNEQDFYRCVDDALCFDTEVLIEQCIEGREIEVAVLEDWNSPGEPITSQPGEICVSHRDGYYSYQAKYVDTESLVLEIPAKVEEFTKQKIQSLAAQIFNYLKCNAMARVDLFLKESGELVFNEVNTIPGFTQYSMYPKLLANSGIKYNQLLDSLINLAINSKLEQQELITSYQ